MELHTAGGHSSVTDMSKLLKTEFLWTPDMTPRLQSVVDECGCSLADPIRRIPKVSESPPPEIGEHLGVDIVYFRGFPHCHGIDHSSNASVVERIANRTKEELRRGIGVILAEFARTRKHSHEFRTISLDAEFTKITSLTSWLKNLNLDVQPAAVEAHAHNGHVEVGNRMLRLFFRRLCQANARVANKLSLVPVAVAAKNACIGSRVCSSAELWGSPPAFVEYLRSLTGKFVVPASLVAAHKAKQDRIRQYVARRERGKPPVFAAGDWIQVYRDRDKLWHGPAKLLRVDRQRAEFTLNGYPTSADTSRLRPCDPPFEVLLAKDLEIEAMIEASASFSAPEANSCQGNATPRSTGEPAALSSPHQTSDTENALPPPGADTVDANSSDGVDPDDSGASPATPIPVDIGADGVGTDADGEVNTNAIHGTSDDPESPSNSDGPAEPLRWSTRSRRAPDRYNPTAFISHSFFAPAHAKSSFTAFPFRFRHPYASKDDKLKAYGREKDNWVTRNAMRVVPRSSVPKSANIIPSSVVYRFKVSGDLKARIVPDGSKDQEKLNLDTACPSMCTDSFKLLCSKSAEHPDWPLISADVKAAFLQAAQFRTGIFVVPPPEEDDSLHLWELTAAAYGLGDSGKLWYMTSSKKCEEFGLEATALDKTLWILRRNSRVVLVMVVQIDNYIITGEPQVCAELINFLESTFTIGTKEFDSFSFYGLKVTKDKSGVTLDMTEKKEDLILYPSRQLDGRHELSAATSLEHRFVLCTVGSLLFIGKMSVPVALYTASMFGARLATLTVRDIRKFIASVRDLKQLVFVSHFPSVPSDAIVPRLLVFADSSFYRDPARANDARLGWVIVRVWGSSAGSTAHVLDYASHKLRRKTPATKGAEAQAAVEGYGAVSLMAHLCRSVECQILSPVALVVDNDGVFKSSMNFKRQSDGLVTLDMLIIREALSDKLLLIGWMPGTIMPADPLTKGDVDPSHLMALINRGRLFHDLPDLRDNSRTPHPSLSRSKAVV